MGDEAGDYEDTPDSAPLPARRPRFEAATKPGPRAEEAEKPLARQTGDDDKPAPRSSRTEEEAALCKARQVHR